MGTRNVDTGSARARGTAIGAVGLLIGAWALQANSATATADEPPVTESSTDAAPSEPGPIESSTTEPPPTENPTSDTAAAEGDVPDAPPSDQTSTTETSTTETSTTTTTTTEVEHGGGSGNPSRILFDVDWQPLGDAAASPLDAVLPDGWRIPFVLVGSSTTGSGRVTTAECTYGAAGDNLLCDYHNPGHGGAEGLVVRARPDATYDVSVTGVPDGWDVVGSTVGTFLGRDTCPRGEGGHGGGSGGEGGHTGSSGSEGGHTGSSGSEGGHTGSSGGSQAAGDVSYVCTHVVEIAQRPTTTTTTTTTATTTTTTTTTTTPTTTTTTPASETTAAAETSDSVAQRPLAPATSVAPAAAAPKTLPRTGAASAPLVLLALSSVLTGLVLLRLRRPGSTR